MSLTPSESHYEHFQYCMSYCTAFNNTIVLTHPILYSNLEDPGDVEQTRRPPEVTRQSESTRQSNTDPSDDVIIVDASPQTISSTRGRGNSAISRPSPQTAAGGDHPGAVGVVTSGVPQSSWQGDDHLGLDMVGDVDLTDFDEFDSDEQLEQQLDNVCQGQEYAHLEDGQDWGEEEQYIERELEQDLEHFQDHFDVEGDQMCMENDTVAQTDRPTCSSTHLLSNEGERDSMSLRQKNPKGPTMNLKKPLIASVKPLTREPPASCMLKGPGGISRAGTSEEPVSLTLSDLQSETVWKLYSVVKVKVYTIVSSQLFS